jgi:hypothetical protein
MDPQGNPDVGAINSLAPDPYNPDILYAGTVDGGIWKTLNATASSPTWTPLTENQPTLATGDLAFSPLDTTGNTLYAGTGSFTNGSIGADKLDNGGEPLGVLKTTDGGVTWNLLGAVDFVNEAIRKIVPTPLTTPTGQVVLAATVGQNGASGGVYVSIDGGNTWTPQSMPNGSLLPAGDVRSLVEDPNDPSIVYVGVIGVGVFRAQFSSSTNGFQWTAINSNVPADVDLPQTNNLQLAVNAGSGTTTLFLLTGAPSSMMEKAPGLSHLVFSTNPTAATVNWTEFVVDSSSGASVPQINGDDQEQNNLAVSADPFFPTVVWVTGSAAPSGPHLPSESIVYRGDYTQSTFNTQWTIAVGPGATGIPPGGTTNMPTLAHSDSRFLGFDFEASPNLLLSDDGGVYKLVNPEAAADERFWVSLNGDIQDTEFYGVDYDSIDNIIVGGAQDNGMGVQVQPGQPAWNTGTGGDVTHVAVDNSGTTAVLFGITNTFLDHDPTTGEVTGSEFFRGDFSTQPRNVSTQIQLAATAGGPVGSGLNPADQAVDRGAYIPFALDTLDPQRLLIGYNGLYEDPQNPTDQTGDVIINVTPSGLSGTVSALAYGGTSGGTANLDLAFVGTTAGQVFVRTALGTGNNYANFMLVTTFSTGSIVRSISLDPSDGLTAYLVTSDSRNAPHVWQLIVNSNGSLNTLTEITANLVQLANRLETVVAINPTAGSTALVVGGIANGTGTGLTGVFASVGPVGTSMVWAPLGSGLPNVNVHDLVYNATADLLVAGTFGRGAWTLANVSEVLNPAASGVVLTYGGPGTALTLSESAAGIANVTLSEVSPGQLEINLNGATFASGSTSSATGLTYQNPGSPTTSTFAAINISARNSISVLTANLPDDTFLVGAIPNSTGGLSNLDVLADSITTTGVVNTTHVLTGAGGNVTLAAVTILVLDPGSGITTGDGQITLRANQEPTPASGNFPGIDINGATLLATGTGDIALVGRGGTDAATGLHFGILVHNGAQFVAAGTAAITLEGVGGLGTLADFGVDIVDPSTLITSASGAIQVTGTAGESPPSAGVILIGGATVRSTTGNVLLQGRDTVFVLEGTLVQTTSGTVTLVGGFGAKKGEVGAVTLAGTATGSAVFAQGGTSPIDFTIVPPPTTPVTVTGTGPPANPADLFAFDAADLAVRTQPGTYTANGRSAVLYSNVKTIFLNNAARVDTFYGPNTADRTLLAGLSPQERFVEVLYLNVLGRPGAQAELDGWVDVLNGPGGQLAVANGIERALEGRTRLVDTWYLTYLGRPAQNGEELGWVNLLLGSATAAPQPEELVLSDILGSAEFFSHAQGLIGSGTANQRYVQALYLLLLDRTGNSVEIADQVAGLAAQGQAGLAFEFLTSPEFRTDLVEAYYNVLLHRPSSAASRNGWVFSGIDAATMRVDFESGSEFFSNG